MRIHKAMQSRYSSRSLPDGAPLRRVGVALASCVALGACSFTLDFDELSAGDEQAAGGAAGSSSGGSSGSGATDGGTACGVCDDKDPCTLDLCDTSGETPTCVFEPQQLVPDGMSVTREFDEIHHLNLVSAGGKFYLSTFAREGAVDDLALWTFGRDGDAEQFVESARFSKLSQGTSIEGKLPASGAGLLAKVVGFGTQLYIALAARDAVNEDADVYLVALDDEYNVLANGIGLLSGTRSFAVPDLKRQPILWETKEVVNVGWLTRVGAVFFPLTENAPTHVVTAVNAQAIAPVDNSQVPGVVVVSDIGVTTQLASNVELPVQSCLLDKSVPITRAGSTRIANNLWYTWWSRAGDVRAASDITSMACGAQTCAADRCDEGDRGASAGVRNPDFAVVVRDIAPDLLTLVGAIPSVDGERATLELSLNTVRLASGGTEPISSTSLELVNQAVTDGSGPDYPRVALSGEDRLAVSWLEHTGSKAQLRVERYRMCYPAD